MRSSACRIFVGSFVLLVGIIGLNATMIDAADAVPDNEFKTLVEQDTNHLLKVLNDGKPAKKTADRSIKSSALMIAAYAQSRLGKNAADDAKLVALRDAAIQVATAAGKKNFAGAVTPAKMLSINIAPAANAKIAKVNLINATSVDIEELMYQFKKTTVGGLGIEEDIKSYANKKKTATADQAAAIAQRVAIVGDFCDDPAIMPQGGFGAAKPKKDWDSYNKDMHAAATALTSAAKANNAKGIQEAFVKIDASCVACHNKFK